MVRGPRGELGAQTPSGIPRCHPTARWPIVLVCTCNLQCSSSKARGCTLCPLAHRSALLAGSSLQNPPCWE